MKLVILDRDGVINEDSDAYIKSVAEWQPIPGSLEAIARMCQAGWRVLVASNQSAIGRGLMDYDALFAIHDRMQHALAELGGHIDAVSFAPEAPEQASLLRKPAPGMLLDFAKRLNLNLNDVPVVGDSLRDIIAARAAKARPVLVRTGNGLRTQQEHAKELAGVKVFDDLAAFSAELLAN